jgi:DNA (cytosine-5)-methyltransferase 1
MGWQPAAFSEIEPFPSAVLAHHYPTVPNVGDMTKYKEWDIGAIDLLVGGTPCQSFSVAGLRKGLADPRGNLALVYLGIADLFKPKWIVWENVPGVLSSGGGRDFGSFLGALAQLGYGFAYRVLDAQWFGVAQRRRRVFVVGYLGDWRPAAAVLFERQSLRRDTAPSREKGQRIAGTLTSGAKSSGGIGYDNQCLFSQNGDSLVRYPEDKIVSIQGNLIGREAGGPQGVGASDEGVMYTLTKADVHGVAQPMCFQQNTRDEVRYIGGDGQIAGALAAQAGMKQQNYLAQPIAVDVYNQAIDGQTAATLTEACGGSNTSGPKVMQSMAVRRLTPVECERLQGFPDNYTEIPWRGKAETPDGPRYKALGNSMAVPVMRWIGQRIQGRCRRALWD